MNIIKCVLKKEVLFVLLAISMMALLSGCIGLGEDSKGTPAEDIEDREYLLNIYSPIEGTYQGNVSDIEAAEGFPVLFSIFIVETEHGFDENGAPRFLPVLRGRYKRQDRPGSNDDQILSVSYVPETGEIRLISARKDLLPEAQLSIRGTLRNGMLEARVIKGRGSPGVLHAVRVSADVPASVGDEEEVREFLLETYRRVAGEYEGSVTLRSNPLRLLRVRLYLFIVEEKRGVNEFGEPLFFPALRGRYQQLEWPIGVTDSFLSVRYFPDSGNISMLGMNTGRTDFISITGKVRGDSLVVDIMEDRGILGRLSAVRVSDQADIPGMDRESEERNLLMKFLSPLTGLYTGKVKNAVVTDVEGEHLTSFSVELDVFIVEVQSGFNEHGEPRFLPALNARLRRPGLEYLNYLLSVRYYPATGVLVMKDIKGPQQSSGPGIPGTGQFSFDGIFTIDSGNGCKLITGKIFDHRGSSAGELNVKMEFND